MERLSQCHVLVLSSLFVSRALALDTRDSPYAPLVLFSHLSDTDLSSALARVEGIGVGFAVINDVEVRPAGLAAALAWLPAAAVYKVLWSRVSKEERWHTLALMRRVLPLSTIFLFTLVPIIDPPGLSEFEWTPRRAALMLLSGVAAFFVNWSGFIVLGACSALSHTVLGQAKACVIIIGGWLLFRMAYPPKAIGGACVAIVAMVAYTHFNLVEQEAKATLARKPMDLEADQPTQSDDDSSQALMSSSRDAADPTMRASSA